MLSGMIKNFIGILLVSAFSFVFAGCGKNNAEGVAHTWLTAFHHMDADPAIKLSTPATRNLIETLSSLSGEIPEKTQKELDKITVTIKSVQEDRDKAVVIYTTSDNPVERKLNLVRQSDKWLVAFTKADLQAEMSSRPSEPEQEYGPVSITPGVPGVTTSGDDNAAGE